LLDFKHRHSDRIGQGNLVRVAVTLDDDAAQTYEACPVIAPWIKTSFKCIQHRESKNGDHLGNDASAELITQRSPKQLRETFNLLQRHVTCEAIGYDHIDLAGKNVITFDKPDKIDM